MGSFGVGATLRDERLRRQLSLQEIARQTKISERFLKAIESDDFQILPGVIFTRNFVRQYAAVVELDPGPLLGALPAYDLASAPLPAAPLPSAERSSWDPRWNSALASIAWTVLACGAAVAAYLHFSQPAHPQEVQAAQVHAKPAEPTPANPAKTAPVDASIAHSAAQTTAHPVAETQLQSASMVDGHAVHVSIAAREDSWLQVTAGGKTAFVGILKANESRDFASDGPVKVRTGNAGGIDISLNGKALESLGPAGQIRSVSLTAEGPQYAPKTPPA